MVQPARCSRCCLIMRILTFFVPLLVVSAFGDYPRDVYGNALSSCSSAGMALTGYTRMGYCVDQQDDSGSHHICIDLSSTSNNGNNKEEDEEENDNFCTATGQYDWCSEYLPCHEDESSSSTCPVQNWCVCQWAFAAYIQTAGGCDAIQSIVCEAINMEAIVAYQQQVGDGSGGSATNKYAEALDCIVNRCGMSQKELAMALRRHRYRNSRFLKSLPWAFLVMGSIGLMFALKNTCGSRNSKQESLLTPQ